MPPHSQMGGDAHNWGDGDAYNWGDGAGDGAPAYDYQANTGDDYWGPSFVQPDAVPKSTDRSNGGQDNGRGSNDAPAEAPPHEYPSNDEENWGYNPNTNHTEQNGAGGNRGRGSRSQKGSYALSLQRACKSAATAVHNNNMVANSAWAAPLKTAPYAVSIMAVLLKAADQKAAAGLMVETQDILESGKKVGTLPSKYFHTNLQHCADLGRLAFRDAQHSMSAIRQISRSLIGEDGAIGTIMDLLEDPEDARYDLKNELEALRHNTTKCLKEASGIKSTFEYWFLVIIHLKEASLSRKDEVVLAREKTDELKTEATQRSITYDKVKVALKVRVQNAKDSLEGAKQNCDRAQDEYDRLCHMPIRPDPDVWQEIKMVNRAIPNIPPPIKERGLLTAAADFVFGQSAKHEDEDRRILEAHNAKVQKLRDDAMAAARKRRNEERREAAARLQEAKVCEQRRMLEWHSACKELNNSTFMLAEAQANLSKANSDMNMLERKDVELAEILRILDNSAVKLGELKNLLDPLVTFFDNIYTQVNTIVTTDVQKFLRPIEARLQPGSPEATEAMRFGRAAKKSIATAAFKMQGEFSAITDIASAYVRVSSEYIRPAIIQMEELSTIKGPEWQVRSAEFTRRCNDAMSGIEGIAEETNRNVAKNVNFYINALQRRVIEAAADL